MIKVPEKIKKILKSDKCKKNIRIVFPNHDHEDICNDKIVKDSFLFAESICSGDSLTLGIMESPVISFECVGIPNIRGKVIKVYCEILCDAGDTPDAVYMADIGSYVYQIPYGVFTVSECQRQADMEHRVVTAYANAINDSLALKSDYMSSLNVAWKNQKIPVRVHIEDIEKMNFFDEGRIDDEVRLITNDPITGIIPLTEIVDPDGNLVVPDSFINFTIASYYKINSSLTPIYLFKDITELVKDFTYYKIEGNFAEYLKRCYEIRDSIADIYKNIEQVNIDKAKEEITNKLSAYIFPNKHLDLPTTYKRVVSNYSSSGNYQGGSLWGDYLNKDAAEDTRLESSEILTSGIGCMFNSLLQEITEKSSTKETVYIFETKNYIFVPNEIIIEVTVKDQPSQRFTLNGSDYSLACKSDSDVDHYILKSDGSHAEDDSIFKIDFNRSIRNKVKRRKQTLNSSRRVTESVKEERKEYLADLSILSEIENRDIMASYAELQGKLGRINRYGKFELVKLNGNDGLMPSTRLFPSTNLYPRGASGGTYFPINYISCWYEDLSIRKIGRINLTYNDANNNNEKASKTYDIVSDFNDAAYCTYTIGSNWILDNCSFTEEEVDEILKIMGANLLDIQYTPCNIEMLGRPDLECGDFIQVVTNKGDVFNTIVFRRTIKGTQLLIDTIEVNATDDAESNNVGSGGSSSSLSGGGSSAVSSVNGKTGDVELKMSDLDDDVGYVKTTDLSYEYDSDTKTLKIIGIGKK